MSIACRCGSFFECFWDLGWLRSKIATRQNGDMVLYLAGIEPLTHVGHSVQVGFDQLADQRFHLEQRFICSHGFRKAELLL
jgi:hypothetical protein